MMNWFKASNNPERKKVEPGATFSLFENHWMQAVSVMENFENSEGALIVISHLSQMISFLGMTRGEAMSDKSCKSFWLQHRCSDKVIKWLHSLQIRGMELPSEDEIKLVAMLHSLCEAASRDGELLGYLKHDNEIKAESWDGAYSLASLLLEYSHRDDIELSETARYSFIMLIQLAPRYPGLEKSLSQETGLGLTNVVVSGLSACFAQLPTFHEASAEQLNPFVEQLKFVDAVTSAGSPTLASNIADCFLNAFLLAIIEPAMIQDGDEGSRSLHKQHDLSYVTSLNEEIGIVTYYVQIVCQNLTHPLLIRNLIKFINSKLLDVLIHRLDHINESVCVAVSTLSLFNILYEFYCEDFWYEVVLKYLLPQNHLMVSQRNSLLPKIDFYDSSLRFLNLVPLTVIDTLGSDSVAAHYVQYLNSESQRWVNLDTVVGTVPCSQLVADETTQENDKANPVYPMWKRSYNGIDVSGSKSQIGNTSSLENCTKQKLDSNDNHDGNSLPDSGYSATINQDPLSSPEYPESPNFTTINLQPGSSLDLEERSSVTRGPSIVVRKAADKKKAGVREDIVPALERLSVLTNHSGDDYLSFDSSGSPVSDDPSNTIGSLGPFLDKIFVQLSNWANLDLNVILMLTNVVSVLASSRIPLITSLLLDPALTLQPCYTSFTTLLKRIRVDLEYHMQKVPSEVLLNVWEMMNPKESQNRRTSQGASALISIASPSSSLGEQIGDTIRRRISGSGAGGAIANVLHMFNRKINTSPANSAGPRIHPSSGTDLDRASSDGTRGYRYLNRQAENLDASRLMAMRMIFFSHWLLELAAIAHQLSWKPAYD